MNKHSNSLQVVVKGEDVDTLWDFDRAVDNMRGVFSQCGTGSGEGACVPASNGR